jgi:ligand-binding SRPBCC domain-containing protein
MAQWDRILVSDYTLQRELTVPRALPAVFDLFSKAENLETLTPPWLRFRIVTPPPIQMRQGTTIDYRLRVFGVPIRWSSEIEVWRPPFEFVDIQVKGPYKLWRHTHRFQECQGGTRISDTVNYSLPLGPLGRLVHRLKVADDLAKIFDYREHRVLAIFG